MSYNTDHLRTAGKITVYTSFIGVVVFFIAFISNLGGMQGVPVADADNASTSVTVLNTPPAWTASTTEEIESSATNPTNAGDQVAWIAIGTDSNSEQYYLLVCGAGAVASATSGGAPECNGGVKWAVSTATVSGTQARAATTTLDSWNEVNVWSAWVCDGNTGTPRCSNASTSGTHATNSSPFEVNHRPNFTSFVDNSPADPGQVVTFTATSYDNDISGTADQVYLTVCATAGFSTTTNSCTGTTLGTSTALMSSNATATYTIVIPTQDQNYGAYGYVTDNHGFEATTTQGTNSTLSVNNVAPTVAGAQISLAQPGTTTDMILLNEATETPGFVLSFVTSDNNNCDAPLGTVGDEVRGYNLSIYRNGGLNSSSTCTASANDYDPNNCYPSGLATTTWNLSCTPNTATCSGASDTDMTWNCTFPLWYIADPTDGTATSTQYSTHDWRAQVQAYDDGQAGNLVSLTGSFGESTIGVDVKSFLAFALNTLSIPYGALEPGQKNTFLVATTTISATGNVGLDKDVSGHSMCTTFTTSNLCPVSSTSTIPEDMQVFATGTIQYDDAVLAGNTLSSTTPKEVEINVWKSTATSSQATGNAFWGIQVPGTISYAGLYTGENTFTAKVGESIDWD